jgi:hypothetical protein
MYARSLASRADLLEVEFPIRSVCVRRGTSEEKEFHRKNRSYIIVP